MYGRAFLAEDQKFRLDLCADNLYHRCRYYPFTLPLMKELTSQKAKALKLMKQAQGTLAKVVSMLEINEYCPDIIQQVDSVAGFLKSVKRELLAGHLDSCMIKKMKENKTQAIAELMKIYNLSS